MKERGKIPVLGLCRYPDNSVEQLGGHENGFNLENGFPIKFLFLDSRLLVVDFWMLGAEIEW